MHHELFSSSAELCTSTPGTKIPWVKGYSLIFA